MFRPWTHHGEAFAGRVRTIFWSCLLLWYPRTPHTQILLGRLVGVGFLREKLEQAGRVMYSPDKDRPTPARVGQHWVASGMQGAGKCSGGVD